jgi:CRP-like cAMP-binding protein
VEGDAGDDFFLIKSGTCVVTKRDPETKQESELCELKKGDYFGEGALRSNSKRAATISARGPCTCLTLSRARFKALLGDDKLQVMLLRLHSYFPTFLTPHQ